MVFGVIIGRSAKFFNNLPIIKKPNFLSYIKKKKKHKQIDNKWKWEMHKITKQGDLKFTIDQEHHSKL